MIRNTHAFAATLCLAILGPVRSASAQHGDSRAGFASLFNDPAGPHLIGLQPPVLGGTAMVRLEVPGSTLAVLMGSITAGSGLGYPFGPWYLDPYALPVLVLAVPLVAGAASVSLPVPHQPMLVGADLAMQAIPIDGLAAFGGTNLLLLNIGMSTSQGSMDFTLFRPVGSLVLGHHGPCENVFDNVGAAAQTVTVTGTRDQVVPLFWRLRDDSQSGHVPPEQDPFTITVSAVLPGNGLELCHYFSGFLNVRLIGLRVD